jgi:hypothetical protein
MSPFDPSLPPSLQETSAKPPSTRPCNPKPSPDLNCYTLHRLCCASRPDPTRLVPYCSRRWPCLPTSLDSPRLFPDDRRAVKKKDDDDDDNKNKNKNNNNNNNDDDKPQTL